MAKPRISIRRSGKHHLGEIEMPIAGGQRITVGSLGWSPLDALRKVVSTAASIATNPDIAPFLPPGVTAAVKTAQSVSQLAKQNPGALKAISPKLSKPARKLAAKVLPKGPTMRSHKVVKPAAFQVPMSSQASSQASQMAPTTHAPQLPPGYQYPPGYYDPYQEALDRYQASYEASLLDQATNPNAYEDAFANDQYEYADEVDAESLPMFDENGMPIAYEFDESGEPRAQGGVSVEG